VGLEAVNPGLGASETVGDDEAVAERGEVEEVAVALNLRLLLEVLVVDARGEDLGLEVNDS